MKETLRKNLFDIGASTVGFAKAGEIDPGVSANYEEWVKDGLNAGMQYLERHIPLRQHTDNVLPGAKTVITLAFSYAPHIWRASDLPMIACYAYGEDYHEALRRRLSPAIEDIRNKFGGNWRICIDSAPVAERYWAQKSGIGSIGLNGSLITPQAGSYCFLCEILTTLEFEPDAPSSEKCVGCGKCMENCPTNAILGNGTIDSRRCFNYLTIEEKIKDSVDEEHTEDLNYNLHDFSSGIIFGCDICQRVCPHNNGVSSTTLPEFFPNSEIMGLDAEAIMLLDEKSFRNQFKFSPLRRAGLKKLKHNFLRFPAPKKVD